MILVTSGKTDLVALLVQDTVQSHQSVLWQTWLFCLAKKRWRQQAKQSTHLLPRLFNEAQTIMLGIEIRDLYPMERICPPWQIHLTERMPQRRFFSDYNQAALRKLSISRAGISLALTVVNLDILVKDSVTYGALWAHMWEVRTHSLNTSNLLLGILIYRDALMELLSMMGG